MTVTLPSSNDDPRPKTVSSQSVPRPPPLCLYRCVAARTFSGSILCRANPAPSLQHSHPPEVHLYSADPSSLPIPVVLSLQHHHSSTILTAPFLQHRPCSVCTICNKQLNCTCTSKQNELPCHFGNNNITDMCVHPHCTSKGEVILWLLDVQ